MFSVKEKSVFYLYRSEYSELVKKQFDLSKYHGMSQIKGWDKEERILEELYLNGSHPSIKELSKYHNSIKRMLVNLLVSSTVKSMQAKDYFNLRLKEIQKEIDKVSGYLTRRQKKKIIQFVNDKHRNLILKFPNENIPLVLSHGDVCCKNLISIGGSLQPIDWEYCEFRSPYYDSQFFLYSLRGEPQYNIELFKDIKKYLSSKLKYNNELVRFLDTDISLLKQIVMLEYIQLVLTQIKYREFAKDINKYIINYIDTLER
ncbi:phosphotransferase family protein [Halobacillus amylolyticus]|uniref:Aminoglycoside phosphotransferase domain-containing protein n=1 Tax=Halobacillus amylolyticus TaxID=2932259 RepID=A0ABY4HGK5_9BACI|nr:hypothetical protein [Halobacillus amylolyticus]UOR13787.1 hypothetical protein MUO15_10270 [Halobacillus amylolyticus]